jgi:glutaredoxin 3
MTAKVTLYTTPYCPYCIRAKQLLDGKQVGYTELGVHLDPALRQEMMRRSGRRTVPQIWIDDLHVGGYDDLAALERRGLLDGLLTPAH